MTKVIEYDIDVKNDNNHTELSKEKLHTIISVRMKYLINTW